MRNAAFRRILLSAALVLGLFHVVTLGQVPPVGVLEGWYADPAYSHHKSGTFDYTMFPGLIEFQNGSFGQGNLRFLFQSLSFDVLNFGLYQARLPMLVGGLFAAYAVYLAGLCLFGRGAGLCSASLFLAAPIFYNAHACDSHSWLAACFILAAYFFLRLLSGRRSIFAFGAGLTVGISVSFHLTGSLGVLPLTAVLLYFRFKKGVDNGRVACYFLGGFAAFIVWYLLQVAPIGLAAFVKKSSYGVQVAQSGEYIGSRWAHYFLRSGRGIAVELPLLLAVLGAYRFFWGESKTRFFYLFFIGLFVAYTLFTGSGSHITVWAALFVLVGGMTSKIIDSSFRVRPLWRGIWTGILALVLLYYVSIQGKRAYEAFWKRPGDHYAELNAQMATHIPSGKTIMGSPLYWFGFVGRNPYITQNFYWERMDKQTGELGGFQQPDSIRVQKMIAFMKRRNIEYLIADPYFQEALNPWIPEGQWNKIFVVLGEFQSPIYGAPSCGGRPPYRIQVWRMKEDIVL